MSLFNIDDNIDIVDSKWLDWLYRVCIYEKDESKYIMLALRYDYEHDNIADKSIFEGAFRDIYVDDGKFHSTLNSRMNRAINECKETTNYGFVTLNFELKDTVAHTLISGKKNVASYVKSLQDYINLESNLNIIETKNIKDVFDMYDVMEKYM